MIARPIRTYTPTYQPKASHFGLPIRCARCRFIVLKSGRGQDWASAVQAHYQEVGFR